MARFMRHRMLVKASLRELNNLTANAHHAARAGAVVPRGFVRENDTAHGRADDELRVDARAAQRAGQRAADLLGVLRVLEDGGALQELGAVAARGEQEVPLVVRAGLTVQVEDVEGRGVRASGVGHGVSIPFRPARSGHHGAWTP